MTPVQVGATIPANTGVLVRLIDPADSAHDELGKEYRASLDEPILSPEERVELAMQKVRGKQVFSEEQGKWLDYIAEHLKQNMTLDETDLKELPVFTDRGGFTKFKKVFPKNYELIINEVNKAIAA